MNDANNCPPRAPARGARDDRHKVVAAWARLARHYRLALADKAPAETDRRAAA